MLYTTVVEGYMYSISSGGCGGSICRKCAGMELTSRDATMKEGAQGLNKSNTCSALEQLNLTGKALATDLTGGAIETDLTGRALVRLPAGVLPVCPATVANAP